MAAKKKTTMKEHNKSLKKIIKKTKPTKPRGKIVLGKTKRKGKK